MKKSVILLLLSGNMLAQSFTNGSVWNFSVGDTVVTQLTTHQYPAVPPTTHYQVFTGKLLSTNSDTVFYNTIDYYYTPSACQGCSPTTSLTVNSFYVTDLNVSAKGYTPSGVPICQYFKDTSYVNSCGLNEHLKYSVSDSCFEPNTFENKIIEGIGNLYYYRCWTCSSVGPGQHLTLIAVHKVGSQACGQPAFVVAGLKNEFASERMEIFPNPGDGELHINFNDEGTLAVRNSLGILVRTAGCLRGHNTVNLTDCAPGAYHLLYRAGNQTVTAKYIKY